MQARHSTIWTILLVGIAALALAGADHNQSLASLMSDPKEKPFIKQGWFYDLNLALQAAKTSRKPILIQFYTTWCGWCKKLENTTFSDGNVTVYLKENFITVKLNAEKVDRIAKSYQVRSFPSFVLLDAKGEEIDRFNGYRDGRKFKALLEALLFSPHTFGALRSRMRDGTANDEDLLNLARGYAARNMLLKAGEAYQLIIDRDFYSKGHFTDRALYELGILMMKQRKYPDALDLFKRVYEKFANSDLQGRSMLMIGQVYELSEKPSIAMGWYKRFIDHYPNAKEVGWAQKKLEKLRKEIAVKENDQP